MRKLQVLQPLPLWVALLVSAAAGIVGATAFAPLSIWAAAFVSLFLLWWCLDRRTFWSGCAVGLVYGFSLWAPLINWLTVYLGPIPWVALAVTESLYISVCGGCVALVLGFSSRVLGRGTLVATLTPVAVAGLWIAHEWLAGTWPWGGFAWARFGMAQYASMFAHSLSWIGSAGVGFVIAWLTASIYFFCARPGSPRRTLALPAIATILCAVLPLFPTSYRGSISVAGVQGNTKSGLFDIVHPGDNLEAHVQTTLKYVHKPVDLIVWPENAVDINPREFFNAATRLDYLSEKFDAPILTGTITHPAPDRYFNSSLLWHSGGVLAQYDKAHPVPFAEWMPARDFFHLLVPDLVDMVTREYAFGSRSNVISVNDTRVGVSICFDIVDDSLIREMLSSGAQVIVAQTNNADFGKTAESAQQLEIARVRALESGRYLLNVSTVGITALIDPSGQIIDEARPFEAAAIQAERVPLASSTPPGEFSNLVITAMASVFGLLWFSVIVVRRTHRYRVARANRPVVRRG